MITEVTKQKFIRLWPYITIFLVLLLILLRLDFVTPLNFDSAYNLIVVRTLLQKGVYGTDNFLLPGQQFFPFDVWITTGYPLILLTALTSAIFGFTYLTPRILMNLFFLLFIFALWKVIVNQLSLHAYKIPILISLIAFSFFFGLNHYAVHTLGEIPSFAFLILAFLVRKKSAVLSGLLLSFASLTKNLLLFVCIPYFLLSAINYFQRKNYSGLIAYILAFSLPIVLLLISITHYYSLPRYTELFLGTIKQNPFDFPYLLNPMIFGERLRVFANFDVSFFMLLILFLSLYATQKSFRSTETTALSFLAFYFLFFYPEFIARHFLLLKLIGIFYVYCYGLFFISQHSQNNNKLAVVGITIFLVFISALSLLPILRTQPEFRAQKEMAEIINTKFKNDTIFFYVWWKSPEIQILADRNFVLLHPDNQKFCTNRCYLLIDPQFKALDPQQYQLATAAYNQPSFSYSGYDFYEIPH